MLIVCICCNVYVFYFFFFSSRRRHTRCGRDWSSDVCSSDLVKLLRAIQEKTVRAVGASTEASVDVRILSATRSEERRVGKSVDLGGRRIIKKKKKKNYIN